jgi:hypothetical protein
MRKHGSIIAEGRVSRIEVCGCDGVHVTIGAVTVRLPPGCFEDFSATVAEASATLSLMAATARGASSRH